MIIPRRRQPTKTVSASAPVGEPSVSETYRPMATGAFPRHCAAPTGAAPLVSLPDSVPIVRDEESDAPQAGIF